MEKKSKHVNRRRLEAAQVSDHVLYYARQQEQMRDKIMNERKEEQILLENDYTFVEVKDRLFTIYKKESPTEQQIKEGKTKDARKALSNVNLPGYGVPGKSKHQEL